MSWWPGEAIQALDRLGRRVLGRVVVPGDDLARAEPGDVRVVETGRRPSARSGSVWLITSLAAMTSARVRAIAIRSGSMRRATRPAAARLRLVRVTRSNSAWASVAAVTGSDVPRSTVWAMAGPASGTRSIPARRTGTRRRVEVSTERSSPHHSLSGNGSGVTVHPPRWYGHRTALRLTVLHRVRTALTGRPPKGCGTMGPTTPDHPRLEGEIRCLPSDEPRPPGPAP